MHGIEDHGEWLNFRLPVGEATIPVRVSREALEDHFEVGKDLVAAYRANEEAINAAARRQIISGERYSREAPLVLETKHF